MKTKKRKKTLSRINYLRRTVISFNGVTKRASSGNSSVKMPFNNINRRIIKPN